MTKDYFSVQSAAYRESRPTYPDAFFAWLASIAPERHLAWDCGCGSGQATVGLANHFDRVIATDLSANQIAQAPGVPNVEYRVEAGEATTLAAQSVDLTLVAQALHWFDLDAFYPEVHRVTRPGGVFVAISYNFLEISPALDVLVNRLYSDVLGAYWPPERRHVENGYRSLPFPFVRLPSYAGMLAADWDLAHLLRYFDSWSATAAYLRQTGVDPVAAMRDEFAAAWGNPSAVRRVAWPLTVHAGTVGG
ncbi:SAM-dependent methyltransferase [Pandoraea terrae]|uniref:SAM-dependent methyltransferase n=1 Tax=Pandoraea terrae TaxID=1537710 RepID=A0A5E4T6Y2_9BURK|nr:class I SAM-dependent methyltransferase [Pandoraea terrae]VVD82164.1 SAM-dependent methyltransferase [Pandoraea terrae]